MPNWPCGATEHTDIGGKLNELVNAPTLEPYKNLTGEEFVRDAVDNIKKYKLPDHVLQDYVASYAGARFFEPGDTGPNWLCSFGILGNECRASLGSVGGGLSGSLGLGRGEVSRKADS